MEFAKLFSVSVLFLLMDGVSLTPSDLNFYFNITPVIRPNSTFTFVLSSQNSSPSASYRIYFEILNIGNNETIASGESKEINPGWNGKQLVSLEIPQEISIGTFALRTRSFRLNDTHPPRLETETLHNINVDLRNSTILLHLNKPQNDYAQGDTVEFTLLVLDVQRRPIKRERKVSISIWKSSPEHFLIRRFPSVSIHPARPFVPGTFQIPRTFYSNSETKETFHILVTIDDASTPGTTNHSMVVEGQTIQQKLRNLKSQELLIVYAHVSLQVSSSKKVRVLQGGKFWKIVGSPFITLRDPQVDVEVEFKNSLGFPVRSGDCSFKYLPDNGFSCFTKFNETRNLTEGRLSTRLNLTGSFDPECLRNKYFNFQHSLKLFLAVACNDKVLEHTGNLGFSQKMYISGGNFLISHATVNSPNPVLVFRVTGKDFRSLGSEINPLQVSYVFHNGSQLIVNESLTQGGIPEHELLLDLVDQDDLSHLTAEFKDSGPLRINKCKGCREKVASQRGPVVLWVTGRRNESRHSVTSGETLEIAIVSNSPLAHFHMRFTPIYKIGDEWESLEELVTRSKASDSRFVTFVNFTVLHGVRSIQFLDGNLWFDVEEEPLRVEIKETAAKKGVVVVSTPRNAGGSKVFGVATREFSADEDPVPDETIRVVGSFMCQINASRTLTERNIRMCDLLTAASSKERESSSVGLGDVEISGDNLEEFEAKLRFDQKLEIRENEWVWNSSATSSGLPSIEMSVGTTGVRNVFGVIIDDLHGYRLTRPATFDPKTPFGLFLWPYNSSDPETLRFTLFNNSNETLTNLYLFQEDLNKHISFQGTLEHESFTSNSSLPFEVPPYGHRHFSTSFRTHRHGTVNFQAVVSANNVQSTVRAKFLVSPRPTDFVSSFNVLIQNPNQSESTMSLTIPSDVTQLLKPNTNYQIDVSLSFNFLPEYAELVWRLARSHRAEKYVFISGLIPFHASLGNLTPKFKRELMELVTSELAKLKLTDFYFLGDSTSLVLRNLLILNNLERGMVDVEMAEDLIKYVLKGLLNWLDTLADPYAYNFPAPMEIFTRVQDILALQAALNYSELFQPNSTCPEELSGAIAKGTEAVLAVVSSSRVYPLDILAVTYLLQETGHSGAQGMFDRARPIVSQIVRGERGLSLKSLKEIKKIKFAEESLALLIMLKAGNLKEAYIIAKALSSSRSSYNAVEEHLGLHALTEFAEAAKQGEFLSGAIFVRPQKLDWTVGDDVVLQISGKGNALATVFIFEF